MKSIDILIEHLNTVENWDSNESFLRDAFVLASAKLLSLCHEEADHYNIVIVAPSLSQVQKNLVVISRLVESVLTTEQFIN